MGLAIMRARLPVVSGAEVLAQLAEALRSAADYAAASKSNAMFREFRETTASKPPLHR